MNRVREAGPTGPYRSSKPPFARGPGRVESGVPAHPPPEIKLTPEPTHPPIKLRLRLPTLRPWHAPPSSPEMRLMGKTT
jgi:hypothetical protein